MAMIHTLFDEDFVNVGHLTDVTEGLDAVRDAVATFTPDFAETQTGIIQRVERTLDGVGREVGEVSAAAGRDRSGVLFLSGALVVVGLVLLIEPGAFVDFLGANEAHGLTYSLTGAGLLLAGLFAPTVSRNEQVITEHR